MKRKKLKAPCACGGYVRPRYRQKKSPTFRCDNCRAVHVPQNDRPMYMPGGSL